MLYLVHFQILADSALMCCYWGGGLPRQLLWGTDVQQ
jgi:hypothetical protein